MIDHIQENITAARADFKRDIQPFLTAYGISPTFPLAVDANAAGAAPIYIVTGASFTPYTHNRHGEKETHAYWQADGNKKYLMNNTAALVTRLLDAGARVVCHSKDPDTTRQAIGDDGQGDRLRIIGGDLARKNVLTPFYEALASMAESQPIAEIRLGLYNSFAQSSGDPFKPIHIEDVEEVEGAATRRLKFFYNMAAFCYDLLVNRGQESLRIVSLSALASKRPSYGLLADVMDKVTCDTVWETFHNEANFHTGKPVSVFQVNPGIVTAGVVYEGQAKTVVLRESIADGFPLSHAILSGEEDLPQMSSHDVALAAERLLRCPDHADPNMNLPPHIRSLLTAGRETVGALRSALDAEIAGNEDTLHVGTGKTLPAYVFASHTVYGALPHLLPGVFRRVMLTPRGQDF